MASTYGAIKEFLIEKPNVHRYSFKEACSSLGSVYSHLVQKKSSRMVDCTGKNLNIDSFCQSKHKASHQLMFSRVGESEVECHLGKSLKLSYICTNPKKGRYCDNDPKQACRLLRERFAQSHHIEKVLETKTGSFNCYFSEKKKVFSQLE